MYQPPNNDQTAPNISPPPPGFTPPAPQMPKRKRKLWPWLIGTLVVLVVSCSFCAYVGSKLPPATTASQPTSVATTAPTTAAQSTTAPTSAPTTKPATQPTAAPTTQPTSGPARLGSDIGTFTAHYGQPNSHSSGILYHFQQYSNSNVDFLIVMTGLAEGGAYAKLAETITAQAPSDNWTKDQAESICAQFYPADAQYQSQKTYQNGYDKIYFSASLAKIFPASAFIDQQQNPVKPGLFDVSFLDSGKGDGTFDSCDMGPGTQTTLQ